jgi:hypothetical protein
MEIGTLRDLARAEGLPEIDDALAATVASITVGRHPILLGTTVDGMRRLGRALTGAIAASSSTASIIQGELTAVAGLTLRVAQEAGEGWVIISCFTDRPDLSFRLDFASTSQWRAVFVTTAPFEAVSLGLAPGQRRAVSLINTGL